MDDETALVAVFGRGDAGDHLHGLHGVLRNLVRVHAALLIGDRLVVNRELRLRVVSDGMKETVRVGHDAGRCQGDDLVEPRSTLYRQPVNETLIDVRVRRRIAFDEILGVTDHLDRCRRAGEHERDVELDRHGAAHVHISPERCKALRADRKVIGVGRKIAKHESAGSVGCRVSFEPCHGVAELHRNSIHQSACGILDRSLNGSCAAEFLSPSATGADDGKGRQNHNPQRPREPEVCPIHETSLPKHRCHQSATVSAAAGVGDRNRTNGAWRAITGFAAPMNGGRNREGNRVFLQCGWR